MNKQEKLKVGQRAKFFPPLKNLHYRILNFWPIVFWALLVLTGAYLVTKVSDGSGFSGVYECDVTRLSVVEDGIVESVYVTVGDEVDAGAYLVKMDTRLLDAEISERLMGLEGESREFMHKNLENLQDVDLSIQEWNLTLQQAGAEHAYLSEELVRLEALMEKRLISQDEYLAVKSRSEQLRFSLEEIPRIIGSLRANRSRIEEIIDEGKRRAELDVADPVVESLEIQRERMSILANRAGVVSQVFYGEGEVAKSGEVVVELAHLNSRRVRGFLPFTSRKGLQVGDVVEVSSTSEKEVKYSGKVTMISPLIMDMPSVGMGAFAQRGYWFYVEFGGANDFLIGEPVNIRLDSGLDWKRWIGGI